MALLYRYWLPRRIHCSRNNQFIWRGRLDLFVVAVPKEALQVGSDGVMKERLKILALVAVTMALVEAVKRAKQKSSKLTATVKIADLDEYKKLLKELQA